ncbi:hypothetical protein PsYK624_030190 [Phanerochaete sordida]|uniref:Uncharacterized protein n=1 Tax=Phanerochaete sordida TaxID=48140 RepID=A0A9P3L972_9APHY|nr:hypothetical protein PsYK624_030190 [Phanerochaete sordida]
MLASDIARQLRLLLKNSPDAPSLSAFHQTLDQFASQNDDNPEQAEDLQTHLQDVYYDGMKDADLPQVKVILETLYHVRRILPPLSIIETWFDTVLRPALREPKLAAEAVDHAKEVIVAALSPIHRIRDAVSSDADKNKKKEKAREFRRRLMDLYLLDAYNESSGDDVLEWAELDDAQKERRACWKSNLEDVLVRIGLQRPQDLLTELHHCFSLPSSRLQLLLLLNAYTSQPNFPQHAGVLAAHPLMQSLIHCLVFDNSATECTVGVTVLTKLLPILAVKACDDLKRLLPQLLVVLARIICWETRPYYTLPDLALEGVRGRDPDTLVEPVIEDQRDIPQADNANRLAIRADLEWERLEQTFIGASATAPPRQQYFAYLYYLFPCNTVRFLRGPVSWLAESDVETVYTISWEEALDEDKIRSKSESLLRGHILHPLLIWRDAAHELAQPDFWAQYDVPKIVAECSMLDVRAASMGLREQLFAHTSQLSSGRREPRTQSERPEGPLPPPPPPPQAIIDSPTPIVQILSSSAESGTSSVLHTLSSAHPTSSKLQISLQEMISTSIALKSGLDIEVIDAPNEVGWAATLVEHQSRARSRSPSRRSTASVSIRSHSPDALRAHEEQGVPSHVAVAIAGLQREILMLRSELNFELWMARENVKHIGRLYQDRVVSRTAEVERQGLHNRLREYKAEVYRLQKEVREQKEQALKVKNQYADWNRKLQDKIKEFRNEKSSWQTEASAMRAEHKETRDSFAAQSKLLSEANSKVFELKTEIKANQHKVDRLHDYERQIEQLIKLQRLWESDVHRLNSQTEFLGECASTHKKMELRVANYQQVQEELEEKIRRQQQEMASLESRLVVASKQLAASRKATSKSPSPAAHREWNQQAAMNKRLREENSVLYDENEELKAMIEMLKAQVSGRTGLVSDPRASPFMGPTLSI